MHLPPPGIFLYFCALSLRSDPIVSSKKPQDINPPYVSCSSVVVLKTLLLNQTIFRLDFLQQQPHLQTEASAIRRLNVKLCSFALQVDVALRGSLGNVQERMCLCVFDGRLHLFRSSGDQWAGEGNDLRPSLPLPSQQLPSPTSPRVSADELQRL